MNQLSISIQRNGNKNKVVSDLNHFNNGGLNLSVERIPVLVFGNHNYCYSPSAKIVTAIIGYISNLEHICSKYKIEKCEDVEVLQKLYKIADLKFLSELEGVFTAFIWDEDKQKGFVFQDEFGSNLPLYYARTGSGICISTSLKEILTKDIGNRKMDISAVHDFMTTRTIIPNKRTFIQGISKLIPMQYLVINGRNIALKTKFWHYAKKKPSLDYAKTNLISTLEKSIYSLNSLLKSPKRICTLSAGFDSNAILHYLSGLSENILALTIGGQKKSEIANAKKLAANYGNVKHVSAIVEDNKLDMFPDIVWRNEGYVCESGLFLQYELASMLNNMELSELFCGECADQILNQFRKRTSYYYLKQDLKSYFSYVTKNAIWPENFRESKLFKYLRRPTLRINYDIELDYILKKSGIMMNSFGIQPLCPFVSRHLAEISAKLGKLNKSKNFFKKELQPVLGESKMALISKAGGSTDVEYLFKGYDEIVDSMLELDFFKPFLSKKQIRTIKLEKNSRSEMIIRLIFLYVFNVLFISGKYDSELVKKDCKITLKELLKDSLNLKG